MVLWLVGLPACCHVQTPLLTLADPAGNKVEERLQQARVVQVLWPFVASFVSRCARCWPHKEAALTQCAPLMVLHALRALQ